MKEVRYAYGLKGDRLYHILEVENGLACNCVCPNCGRAFIAKNGGTEKQKHFAHHHGEECPHGAETAIHRMAIQILLDHKQVTTPPFDRQPLLTDLDGVIHYGERVLIPAVPVHFDNAIKECDWGGYRPDVTGFIGARRLHIEVRVFHAVDEDKRQRVAVANEPMMEIDLSRLPAEVLTDKAQLEQAVLFDAENRVWIHSPKGERQYQRAMETLRAEVDAVNVTIQQRREEKERKRRERDAKKRKLALERERARAPYLQDLASLAQAQTPQWLARRTAYLEENVSQMCAPYGETLGLSFANLPPFLDVAARTDWIVNAHRRIWQAALYIRFIHNKPPGAVLSAGSVTEWLKKTFGLIDFVDRLSTVKAAQKQQGRERGQWYGEEGCWFLTFEENHSIPSPFGLVLRYLESLMHYGILDADDKKYRFRVKINTVAEFTRLQQERLEQEVHDRLERERRHRKAAQEEEMRRYQLRQSQVERCAQLIASERRVFDLAGGDGRKCKRCFFVSSAADGPQCLFCGAEEFQPFKVTAYYLEHALHRYRSDPNVAKSVAQIPVVANLGAVAPWLTEIAGANLLI